MVGRLLRSTETAIASARFYGSRWRAGLPLETPDDRAEAIMQVTAAEVQSIAEEIASGIGDVRMALVGPSDQGDELLSAIESTASQLTPGSPQEASSARSRLSATRSRSRVVRPGWTGSERQRDPYARARGVSSRCTLGWVR